MKAWEQRVYNPWGFVDGGKGRIDRTDVTDSVLAASIFHAKPKRDYVGYSQRGKNPNWSLCMLYLWKPIIELVKKKYIYKNT